MALFDNQDNQVTTLQEQNVKLQAMVDQLQNSIDKDSIRHSERIQSLQKPINQIIDNLTIDSWYNPNYDKLDVLRDLCEILEHEPKQTIEFSARVTVNGSMDVALDELEDLDLTSLLQEELSISAYNGDIEINDFDVDWADQS